MNRQWSRPLYIATAIAFLVSTLFPLGAGLSKNTSSFPRWWGPADVGTALLLAARVLAVLAIGTPKITKQDEEATYRAYRVHIHVIFVLMVVFVFFRDRIAGANACPDLPGVFGCYSASCLPGLPGIGPQY